MSQSGSVYDQKIPDLVKDIKLMNKHFPYHENLVEYLTSTKSDELKIIVDKIQGKNHFLYATFLRRFSSEMKRDIETLVDIFPNMASPTDIRCLTADKVIEKFLRYYLRHREFHLYERKALSDKISDIVLCLLAFDLGFIRLLFPGKKRFSGSAVVGANLAVNKIVDSLLEAKIKPYLYLVPYCELVGPESKAFELSEISREFLKLKTTADSIAFIKNHPEIRDCKYRQEIQHQAYKACLKGDGDYSVHCTYQMSLLLCVSAVGNVYIKHVEILGQPESFENGIKNSLKVMRERCEYLNLSFIDNFKYDFSPPEGPHAFIVDIPKDGEDARFEPFNDFPDQIKDALSSGNLDRIRKKFKELSQEDFKKYLIICAQHGFFYFAINIDMKKFGPYRKHIESLEIF